MPAASYGHHSSLSMPNWEPLHQSHDMHDHIVTGSKRSHESISVEDFLLDVKKRKVAPTYDPRESLLYISLLLPVPRLRLQPRRHGRASQQPRRWTAEQFARIRTPRPLCPQRARKFSALKSSSSSLFQPTLSFTRHPDTGGTRGCQLFPHLARS